MKVLFVCTGNTCRSPMLKYMFDAYAAKHGANDIVSDSAGIAGGNEFISDNAAATLRKHSIPFGLHVSKACTAELINTADIIFTMTDAQAKRLENEFGKNKIFPLSQIVGNDIQDPYGCSENSYEEVFAVLEGAIPKILEFIRK